MMERLEPNWLFRTPMDFEYNKYVLLNYIKSSEVRLNNLNIYPDLQEVTISIINLATIIKDNKILLINKILKNIDDEVNLSDFTFEPMPELSEFEKIEVTKTIKFSYPKLLDLFNFAKSIWVFAFDNTNIIIKKNKNASLEKGYFYFFSKKERELYLFSFDFTKNKKEYSNYTEFTEIFVGNIDSGISISIVLNLIKNNDGDSSSIIYEVKSNQDFPINETLIPIVKRKIILRNKPNFSKNKYIN
ncbi:MAG: hypothetical protein K9I82_02305 [Chitinophagaceae bacterium]|jgi:hypothetical protein|nr:hypothetical protein [Chitinophagaceae bacterium]